MLLVARVIQGIGGSMSVPVPRLTLLRVYDKSQLLNAINYAVMPALIGWCRGPLVGGYLVDYASWHWIFLIKRAHWYRRHGVCIQGNARP